MVVTEKAEGKGTWRGKKQTRQRVEEILRRVRMDPVLARPAAEALARTEERLAQAAAQGDTKAVDTLSLAMKRLQETLGLTYAQRPPEADPNQKSWLQALAHAAAALRFAEVHAEEESTLEGLFLEMARTQDESLRAKVREASAALQAAYAREMPTLYRAEMERVAGERGIEAAPDWLAWPSARKADRAAASR